VIGNRTIRWCAIVVVGFIVGCALLFAQVHARTQSLETFSLNVSALNGSVASPPNVGINAADQVPHTIAGKTFSPNEYVFVRLSAALEPSDGRRVWIVSDGPHGNIARFYHDSEVPRRGALRILPVRKGSAFSFVLEERRCIVSAPDCSPISLNDITKE
jgi:hypothetical protein